MFENNKDLVIDGIFFSAPKCIYQILIIRVKDNHSTKYTTICFALCKNKIEQLYKWIISEINKNINIKNGKKFKNKNVDIYFEITLSNAIINNWNICYIS